MLALTAVILVRCNCPTRVGACNPCKSGLRQNSHARQHRRWTELSAAARFHIACTHARTAAKSSHPKCENYRYCDNPVAFKTLHKSGWAVGCAGSPTSILWGTLGSTSESTLVPGLTAALIIRDMHARATRARLRRGQRGGKLPATRRQQLYTAMRHGNYYTVTATVHNAQEPVAIAETIRKMAVQICEMRHHMQAPFAMARTIQRYFE